MEDIKHWTEEAAKLRIPSLGHDDSYFLGSGVVGISGLPDGRWDFAIGPDYTCPNFIDSETLTVSGIGALSFEMFRLRGCGTFFGMASAKGLYFTVTDACPKGSSQVLRLLTVENGNFEPYHAVIDIVINADADDVIPEKDSAEIKKPPERWCFGNHETKNWAERRLRVTAPGAECIKTDSGFILRHTADIAPGEMVSFPVWHSFAYGRSYADIPSSPYLFAAYASASWKRWLDAGEYPNAINDRRLRDIVESLLLTVKMQQNHDGGMIAGIRKYANSYVRDCHGGARLLSVCGHADDVGKILLNIHGRWKISGFIPNWWSMGSDTFIGDSFHNGASEITAYYIFMLRDYLVHGTDKEIADIIMPSVTWAADRQAEYLQSHDLLMDFNGDETEQYCSARDGEEYGLFGSCFSKDRLHFDHEKPSFASTAAAAGSLRWFGEYSGKKEYTELAEKVSAGLSRFLKGGSHGWIIDGGAARDSVVTNYLLLPLWLSICLPDGLEKDDALSAVSFRRDDTGFIPNSPVIIEGFCGHTLGMALYDMLQLGDGSSHELADTIINSGIIGRYGTISEFYGPSGVPNGHGSRPFEGGIVGEALVMYAKKNSHI